MTKNTIRTKQDMWGPAVVPNQSVDYSGLPKLNLPGLPAAPLEQTQKVAAVEAAKKVSQRMLQDFDNEELNDIQLMLTGLTFATGYILQGAPDEVKNELAGKIYRNLLVLINADHTT